MSESWESLDLGAPIQWRVRLLVSPPLTLGAESLLEPPSFERSLQPGGTELREMRRGRARMVLDPSAMPLKIVSGATQPIGVVLEVESGAVWVEAFRGILTLATNSNGRLELDVVDGMPGTDRPLCPEVVVGRTASRVPVVFGEGWAEPVPLFEAPVARLRADLTREATEVELDRAVSWAAPGAVQVQDERIGFASISGDGRVLLGLTRAEPRNHRRRAHLSLLPADDPVWACAAHPANAVSIRVGDQLGPELEAPGALPVESVVGRPCAVYRRTQLPVDAEFALAEVTRLSELDPDRWAFDEESSALDPRDAVQYEAPRRGAVFSVLRPWMDGVYTEDVAAGNERFDQLLGAALVLEYSKTFPWEPDTELRVRVEKGPDALEMIVRRGGDASVGLAAASVSIAPEAFGEAPLERLRIPFESVEATGPWVDPSNAITLPYHVASSASDPGEFSLEAALVVPSSVAADSLRGVRLRVLGRSLDAGGTAAALEITASASPGLSEPVTLPEGTPAVVDLEIPINEERPASDILSPDARFRIRFPDGGNVEVYGMWLEVERAPVAALPAGAPVVLPIEGEITLGSAYDRARMDVSSLLPVEDRWSFFTAAGGPLRVTIELLNPPDAEGWALYLRGLRWERRLLPASSIRPTTRLAALVRGIGGDQPTANPAVAIEDLLTSFCEVAVEDLEAGSFAAAEDRCAERGLGLAAVIRDDRDVASALGAVLAEATLALLRHDGRWALRVLPIAADDDLVPTIDPELFLEGALDRTLAPGVPAEPPPVRLVSTGRDIPARRFDALHPPLDERLRWQLPVGFLGIDVGAMVATTDGGARLQGLVRRVELLRGRVALEVAAPRRVEIVRDTAFGRLLSVPRRGALRFILNDRPVAELLDDGTLRLAGGVLAEPCVTSGQLLQFSAGRIEVGNAALQGFALEAGGNLRTTLVVEAESSTGQISPGRGGGLVGLAAVLGGPPGEAAALTIESGVLRLGGALLTNERLIR